MKTNTEIQKDVMEELQWEPILNASEIGVAVKDGVVTLSGVVDSYSKKLAAEKAAKRVSGVKAIAEDIEVRFSSSFSKRDSDIASAVLDALKWHSAVQENKIKIEVEDGWVTLDGEVEWEYQKTAAATAIENLLGVRGVTNLIKITPKLSTSDIKRKISAAFHRSATVDAQRVDVETIGSKVILKGKVSSWSDKEDAENTAWSAPGVTTVENKIEVDSEVFSR